MAATEIQSGKAYLFGIEPVTITLTGPIVISGNISNMRWTDNWKEEEMPSQSGSIVEGLVSIQRRRALEFDFAPSSTSRTLAMVEAEKLIDATPNIVVTIAATGFNASAVATSIDGTYNLKSGGTFQRTRDGIAQHFVRPFAKGV